MAQAVRVENLRETVRDLERLGAEVADLEEWRAVVVGDVVTVAAGLVPVADGTLRGRIYGVVTPTKAVVVAATDYARIVNARTGFLTEPANDEDRHRRTLEAHLADVVRQLRL